MLVTLLSVPWGDLGWRAALSQLLVSRFEDLQVIHLVILL